MTNLHECELEGCSNLTYNKRFCDKDCADIYRGSDEGRRENSRRVKDAWARGCYNNRSSRKLSKEHKKRLSEANAGKSLSKTHKQKISKTLKEYTPTEEEREHKSKALKAAWKRRKATPSYMSGDYGCRMSRQIMAAHARGAYSNKYGVKRNRKIAESVKDSWARGDHADQFTPAVLRAKSAAMRRAHARGDWDHVYTEEYAQKISKGVKIAWKRGDYDGVFKNPSSIELLVVDYLDNISIEYTQQFRPEGMAKVFDFYFPETNILLEVQGDYWHNLPGAREKDYKKATEAAALGYTVYEIWEHDVHNNLEESLRWLQERPTPKRP